MRLYELSNNVSSLLMALLYLFLLVQIGCGMGFVRRRKKEWLFLILPVFLFTLLFLMILLYTEESERTVILPGFWNRAGRISAVVVIFLILLIGICTVFLLLRIRKLYRTTINSNSIKESIDNLPTGLGFATMDGLVLLANQCMERLCYELTGSDFQDASVFWEKITAGDIRSGIQRIGYSGVATFVTSDGRVWVLERKQLDCSGQEIFQYTATDTTVLYQMSEKLKENNEELSRMNVRLRRYGNDMEELVRNREILEAKMKIHDEMGQALLATRAWLLHRPSGDMTDKTFMNFHLEPAQEILKKWEYVIALLQKEGEVGKSPNTWRYFTEAADFAGVRVSLEGELPKEPDTMRLLVTAAAEALTNAVRHANADTLFVRILYTNKELRCSFTNNGKIPGHPVAEGGGLSALRMRIEKSGGKMQTGWKPCFTLDISLPKGEKNADKCVDSRR